MDALFRYIDTNDSGYINYDEWINFFGQDFAHHSGSTEEPISPLRRRVLQREMQRSAATPSSMPVLAGNAVPQSNQGERNSILGMLDAKRQEGEIAVAPLRQMQLVDEIRALNLAPGRQVEFLRDLPVSTEKKVQVFRELQLSPVYESKFLADIRAMDDRGFARLEGIHLIEGAGHWVQQEQPEATVARLLAFAAGAGLSPG